MLNLCTSTDYSALSRVFISGTAGVYIGAKDPTELNECQHKRRAVNCHTEISVEIVITRTTIAMQKSQWKMLLLERMTAT